MFVRFLPVHWTQSGNSSSLALVPSLADGWLVITAGGRRLRDVSRRPAPTVVALHVDGSEKPATLRGAPGTHPSSELNSHLAIHDDHRCRRGVDHHIVVHAQPLRLVFLSHLADISTRSSIPLGATTAVSGSHGGISNTGTPRQMDATAGALARTHAVVWAKHGIVTRSDVSATQAADLIEYLEAAAAYEVMNLSMGEPAVGLAPASAMPSHVPSVLAYE